MARPRASAIIFCVLLLWLAFGESALAFWATGHRGVRKIEDENTLEAMDMALERGANALEFDLHLTSDKVIVIMHDPLVDRTTDGHGCVKNKTLAEFKGLRTKRGHVPPTLAQVLERYKDRDITLFLEIKTGSDDMLDALAAALDGYGGKAELIVFDTDAKFLVNLKARTDAAKEFLAPVHPFFPERSAEKKGLDGLLVADFYVTRGLVRRAHERGLPVVASMIGHKSDLNRMLKKGVDGVLVNDPADLPPRYLNDSK